MARETPEDVAAEVRAKRQELGLTQGELAKRLGVTLRSVQYWEAGTKPPSAPILILLRSMKGRAPRPAPPREAPGNPEPNPKRKGGE